MAGMKWEESSISDVLIMIQGQVQPEISEKNPLGQK